MNIKLGKENAERLTSGLASGGVLARGTLYRHFESSVPVPTFANPRPTAKPPGVGGNARATLERYEFVKVNGGLPANWDLRVRAEFWKVLTLTTFVQADSSPLLLESITNRESLAHCAKRENNCLVKMQNIHGTLTRQHFENLDKPLELTDLRCYWERKAVNLRGTAVLTVYRLSVIYRSEENNWERCDFTVLWDYRQKIRRNNTVSTVFTKKIWHSVHWTLSENL